LDGGDIHRVAHLPVYVGRAPKQLRGGSSGEREEQDSATTTVFLRKPASRHQGDKSLPAARPAKDQEAIVLALVDFALRTDKIVDCDRH
jgi:hypothetical protein